MKMILIILIVFITTGCSKTDKAKKVITLSQSEIISIQTLLKQGQDLMGEIRTLRHQKGAHRTLFQKHQSLFLIKKEHFYGKFKQNLTVWSDGTYWNMLQDGAGKKLFQIKIGRNLNKKYTKTFMTYPANYLSRMGWVEISLGDFYVHIIAIEYRKDLKGEFEQILTGLKLDEIKAILSSKDQQLELKKGYQAIDILQKQIGEKIGEERLLGEKIASALMPILPSKGQMAPGFNWKIYYSNDVVIIKLKDEQKNDRIVIRGYYKSKLPKDLKEVIKGYQGRIIGEKLEVIIGSWLFKMSGRKGDDIFGTTDDLKKVFTQFKFNVIEQL